MLFLPREEGQGLVEYALKPRCRAAPYLRPPSSNAPSRPPAPLSYFAAGKNRRANSSAAKDLES